MSMFFFHDLWNLYICAVIYSLPRKLVATHFFLIFSSRFTAKNTSPPLHHLLWCIISVVMTSPPSPRTQILCYPPICLCFLAIFMRIACRFVLHVNSSSLLRKFCVYGRDFCFPSTFFSPEGKKNCANHRFE